MRFKTSLGMVVLAAMLAGTLHAATTSDRAKPNSHTSRNIEGWTVRVDDRLLAPTNDLLGGRALRFLEQKLSEIKAVVAPEPLARLQEVTIVLDLNHGRLRSMQYHPSAHWLRDNGYATNLAKCVHIPEAADLPTPRNINEQPWVILHELAHAYHDQVLGFDEPRILKAYEAFKQSGRGERALLYDGSRVRHYGLTDQKEFFAEMTESYFGVDDFFPFNRAELSTAEPEICELMEAIWGPVAGKRIKVSPEIVQTSHKPGLGTSPRAANAGGEVPRDNQGAKPPAVRTTRSGTNQARVAKEIADYFAADAMHQSNWVFSAEAEAMLRENESALRQMAWETYRCAPIHEELKTNFEARVVKFNEHISPYTVKTVGTRPARGWALFIAMHGGGGAPKQVNDSQWKHMQIYYKDHPEVGGYIYLALRAPNDTWNGFYDTYVYPLIDRLILQFRIFGDIDPDKVFIMGYSHGGYGAYAIGPKMPDRFAAIHASAAAATDGETTGKTLRTTPFTVMVGERDTMYGRYERNLKFKEQIEQLRGTRTDIYPVTVTIVPGNGHTGLPDRDKIVDLYPAVRNPLPREISWLMTDAVVRDFFWLHVPQPAKQQEIVASCKENRVQLTANESVTEAAVHLDTRLVDFNKPVTIEINGVTTTRKFALSLKTFCETLARRGDPGFAFSAVFSVTKDTQSGRLELAPAAQKQP